MRNLISVSLMGCLLAMAAPSAARDQTDAGLGKMLSGGPLLDALELSAAIVKAEPNPLGSDANPVRAAKPAGQRAYLNSLRCADGKAPRYERVGNIGPGVYSSVVDLYSVDCGSVAPGKVEVRIDMYHPGYSETRPVAGFTVEQSGLAVGL